MLFHAIFPPLYRTVAPHHFMHYVYVLRSEVDQKLYIGVSSDLRRRLEEHNFKQNRSTKSRAPFKLVYYEAYAAKQDAIMRERKLKQFKNSYTELKKRMLHSNA